MNKVPLANKIPFAANGFNRWQTDTLQKRAKIAQLLRSLPRKRSRLTMGEAPIFFSIGYLGIDISNEMIRMNPVTFSDVSGLLGISRKDVHRRATKLLDLGYVGSTTQGLVIQRLDIWCQCFSARSADWAAAYRNGDAF